jgi:hypothetical protein
VLRRDVRRSVQDCSQNFPAGKKRGSFNFVAFAELTDKTFAGQAIRGTELEFSGAAWRETGANPKRLGFSEAQFTQLTRPGESS